MTEMKILCYIGARGKSKRLKRKNLQKYGDITLIEHAINNALKSKYINTIIFDSEDKEILKLVRKLKFKRDEDDFFAMPFLEIHKRDPKLSKDFISLYMPVRELLNTHRYFPAVVILQVDNPVENPEIIDKCIETFLEHDDAEDVSTFHNNRRTGTVRVINREFFFNSIPTANIYSVEDRPDFIDIHTRKDLEKANFYLKNKHHDTFQVRNKIREPIQYNTKMIFNHFNRYIKAIEMLNITKEHTVIDASCGQGYGSYLLSLYVRRVWGLDVNKDHLKKAEEFYKTDNIFFHTYDRYDKFKYGNLRFVIDKIACIETIEHMPKKELEPFVKKILNYLKKDGDMFVTSPVGMDKPSEYNKFHLNEPSIETLYALFTPFFEHSCFIVDKFINSYNKEQEYCLIILRGKK